MAFAVMLLISNFSAHINFEQGHKNVFDSDGRFDSILIFDGYFRYYCEP